MKQTNNAIKFLLAQYRAIFKQAYLKGLVSAVVLTTGLATGSTANAAAANIDQSNFAGLSGNITIDGDSAATDDGATGSYKDIDIVLSSATELKNDNSATITINALPSSSPSGSITSSADGAKLTASNIDWNIKSSGGGLTITNKVDSNNASLTFTTKSFNVNTATTNAAAELNITAESGSSGKGNVSVILTDGLTVGGEGKGTVTLTGKATDAVASLEANTISVGSNGTLTLAGNSNVKANTLTVNSGTISTATGVSNAINVGTANFTNGSLTVTKALALNVAKAAAPTAEESTADVVFNGTAITTTEALTLSGGTFDFTQAGTMKGTGGTIIDANATAQFTDAKLTAYLTASSASGAVVVKNGGLLELTDSLTIGGTGVKLAGGTAPADGTISAADSATIIAPVLNLAADAGSEVKAAINVDTLNFKYAGTDSKISNVTVAQNLVNQHSTDVTLSNSFKLYAADDSSGTIAGDTKGFIITDAKKSLDIQGKWTATTEIQLSGDGANAGLSLGEGDSLTFSGSNGKLTVKKSGSFVADSGAELAFVGGTLTIDGSSGTDKNATVEVKNGATLSLDADSTLAITSGTLTVSSGASLDLTSIEAANVTITDGSIVADASGTIAIDQDIVGKAITAKNGGVLSATNLEVANANFAATAIDLTADGTLKVDNLTVTDELKSSSLAGTILVNKTLQGATNEASVVVSAGTLQLGADATAKGSIKNDLTVANTTNVFGTWTGKGLTVSDNDSGKGGKLNVGSATASGNLTVNSIADASTNGKITVNTGSTLTVNGIKDATKVVDGEDVKINAGEAGYAGFDLAGTTVSVDGGTFVIGSTAASQLLNGDAWAQYEKDLKKDPDTAEISDYVYDNFGTYDLSNNGILKVDFSSGSFSVDQFKQMKVELVGADEETGKIADGTINIGNAEIAGVTDVIIQTDSSAGTSGEKFITFGDYNLYKDVLTSTQQEAIMQAQLREVVNTDSEALDSVHVGSIQLAQGETAVDFDGSSSLNNADNAGTLISNSNGEAANANLNAGASLDLNADGAVADIVLAAGNNDDTTVLNVNKQNSFDSIVADNSNGAPANYTVVNVAQGASATIKDKVLVDTLNNQGVIKSASGSITVNTFVDTATSETSAKTIAINDLSTVAGTVTVTDRFTLTSDTLKEGSRTEYVNSQITGKVDASAGQANLSNTSIMSGGSVVAKTTVLDKDFYVAAGGYLKSDSTVIGDDDDGNATNVSAFTTIEGTADLGNLSFAAGTTITDSGLEIFDATVTAKDVTGTSGAEILVGQDNEEQHSGIFEITGTLDQNGLSLVVDPSYEQNTALVAVNTLSGQNTNKTDVGIFNGNVFVGQNSALGVGVSASTLQSIIAQYQVNGHFVDPNDDSEAYGAMLYLDKPVSINLGYGITLTADTEKDLAKHISTNGTGGAMAGFADGTYAISNVIYLGSNTALALNTDKAISNRAYIQFVDNDNEIATNSTVVADGGEIVLYGTNYKKTYQIFNEDVEVQDLKGNSGSITVVSQNGFLEGDLTTGGSVSLNINQDKMDVFMGNTSTPVQQTIVAYLNGYNGEYAEGEEIPEGAYLGSYDKNGKFVSGEYNNDFLSKVVLNGTGADVEKVARLGVYGGTAQAALTAGATTYEAVAGRMGVGAQNGNITFADNGQGAGLWVTPVYKNHDSDGFGAQGLSYGADLDLYGVALGADYTLENGLRVGAAFNVGSGDADGQGAGAGVTNDFDYYGFTVYGGFTMDQLSVVADVSYTAVDNDVEANTSVEKVSASMDSSNLSFGVTAQYAFNMNGVSVTPHAGLRYTNIDLDDYTVRGSADIAKYSADSASIFSIPVGVTFAKEITSGAWTIKPALDLTLTANMGDDSVDGSVTWAGVENLKTNLESEVIDSFTYGAALGVSAKSGNMSFGFGVNYTGASSADEYGVSANARFVF